MRSVSTVAAFVSASLVSQLAIAADSPAWQPRSTTPQLHQIETTNVGQTDAGHHTAAGDEHPVDSAHATDFVAPLLLTSAQTDGKKADATPPIRLTNLYAPPMRLDAGEGEDTEAEEGTGVEGTVDTKYLISLDDELDAPRPFEIPPAPDCEESVELDDGSSELAAPLFESLGAIHLSGLSTEPPMTIDPAAELDVPPNAACEFLSEGHMAVYATEPCFAMPSPYRTPYPFTYNPLYYEDANLERAGVSWGPLTPVKSIGLFGAQIAAWPAHAVITPPRAEVRALPDVPGLNRFAPLGVFNEAWRKHRGYTARIVPRAKLPKPPKQLSFHAVN